jgi:hypothetical protein
MVSQTTFAVYGQETSNANVPKIAWQHEYMGGEGYSIYQLPDGGYVLNAANESATFIVKIDGLGNVKSTSTIQINNEPTVLPYFVQTSDGGYAFASNMSNLYVLAKTDVNGNLLWSKTYPSGAPLSFMRAMIQTSDGGYAMAGFEQIADEDVGTSWFAKADSQGLLLWNKTLSIDGNDCPSAIIQQPDGFILSDVIFSVSPNFAFFRLVKTDLNGNIMWTHTYGDNSTYKNPECNTVMQTKDGGFFLAGWLAGGTKNAWVVKTNGEGAMLWNQSYGERKSAIVGVHQTSDGGYILAATKNVTESWILKTDSLGNQVWNITFSDAHFADLEANYNTIFQTSDGGVVVLGSKDGNVWVAKLENINSSTSTIPLLQAAIVGLVVLAAVLLAYNIYKKHRNKK